MRRIVFALSLVALPAPTFADTPRDTTAHARGPVQIRESRFIQLEGTRNFRDLGGLRTADGKTVKPRLFYRSGPLGSLTDKGKSDFVKLRIARIIDLRTTEERHHDTYNQMAIFGDAYWSRDYEMLWGDMRSLFSDPSRLTVENMRNLMVTAYRAMPKEQAPAYREVFASLLAGNGPVLVNCTAGKDRTGIAVALVLTALGVPYETVRQDFLLSNGAPGMDTLNASLPPILAHLPADVTAPLTGVDGAYLDAAYNQMRKDYGSIEGFLYRELQVGPRQTELLRLKMLH